MFNRQRTKEVFKYDIDPDSQRKSKEEKELAPNTKRNDMKVIDNCPGENCGVEREINYKQSMKNTLCYKCHHNSPEMIKAKQNQTKVKTEEHKQNMRDNHWSKNGYESAFKGKHHTEETKAVISAKASLQNNALKQQIGEDEYKIRMSLMKREITREEWDGFTTPENTRIRQSPEGKAWTLDVLQKANFTCDKCTTRGGSLQAHHLNGFNSFPEQRLLPENGVCLCKDCHDEFHLKYGKGNNTEEQYRNFKSV